MGGAGPASRWVQPLPEPQDPTAQPDLQGVPSDPCGTGLPQGLDLLYSQLPQAGPARAGTGEGLACSLLCPWDSPGRNTGVGCHSLLQGVFPTQGLNPGLLHWQLDSLASELPGKSTVVLVSYLFTCSSVYTSIPISQFTALSPYPLEP